MNYLENLDINIIKFEIFRLLDVINISQFISTCKLYYNISEHLIQDLYDSSIDGEYKDIYKKYLDDSITIGIKNIHIKNLYSMKRLNNHIECTSIIPNKKPLGLYLNIPKVAIWDVSGKRTVIIRTKKQLVKSIYLYFGLKIHKYYWFIPPNQEKLLNLMKHRKYYVN
jgi:hypothetical protein